MSTVFGPFLLLVVLISNVSCDRIDYETGVPSHIHLLSKRQANQQQQQQSGVVDQQQQTTTTPQQQQSNNNNGDDDDDANWKIPYDTEKSYNETADWCNSTTIKCDYAKVMHTYYIQHTYIDQPELFTSHFWIEVDELLKNKSVVGAERHPQLHTSYRRAVATKLTFDFPFYGFQTRNVTIATGGFLYCGEHVHSWLAATQYIAPLMANFDTSKNETATIAYADTGDKFIVEWRNVILRNQEEHGTFAFQCVLHRNGSIWFLYKDVPVHVKNVSDLHHPRKVGLSDAFMDSEDNPGALFTKRVIYEYDRIEIDPNMIRNYTAILIDPRPTCFDFKTCDDCMNHELDHFNCTWCAQTRETKQAFCSDTEGRNRMHDAFKKSQCKSKVGQPSDKYCSTDSWVPIVPLITPTSSTPKSMESSTKPAKPSPDQQGDADEIHGESSGGSGGVVVLTILALIVLSAGGWLAYAYYNPQTTSGQLLIRYRPSRWNFASRGVQYTASVHM